MTPRFSCATLLGVFAVSSLVLTATALAPQTAFDSVSSAGLRNITSERLRAHMAVLADDAKEGRETGTRGFDRAAKYVADQFRALHLHAINGNYVQSMTIRRARVNEGQTVLEITRQGRREPLVYGRDFVTYGVRGETNVSVGGQIVFVGDGVTVPRDGIDAYRGSETVGTIALALPGAPASLSPSERSYYGGADAKAANAAAHGVVALLLVEEAHIPWDLRVRAARQLGVSEGLPTKMSPTVPIVYLNRSVAERIIGQPLENAALQAGAAIGIGSGKLAVRQAYRDVRSANVYAVWPGADPARAREHVVVVAHLDHVGIGAPVNGDSIYNGAVDNASGVAALLAMAKAFAEVPTRPARSVLFLATTGEEQGEIGSEYFVRRPPIPVDSIVAAINVDGISVTAFEHLEISGGSNSSLGAIADAAARRVELSVTHEPLGVGGSDHSPFLLAGIPALWIAATLTDEWMRTRYHTPQDDMRQPLDLAAAARYTQFVFITAYLAADALARPMWNSGEFFGDRMAR